MPLPLALSAALGVTNLKRAEELGPESSRVRDEGDDRLGIGQLRSVRSRRRHGYRIRIFGWGALRPSRALLLLGFIPVGQLIETVHHRREVAA